MPVDGQTADDVTAENAKRGVDEVDATPIVIEPCPATDSATDPLNRYSSINYAMNRKSFLSDCAVCRFPQIYIDEY